MTPGSLPPGPVRPSRAAIGREGETLAAGYLEARGFTILERGFRTREGEIDLVASHGGVLVFVEVKARSGASCGRPSEAVDARKQRRIARAARVWLHRHGASERPCRFDVVEVLSGGSPGPAAVEHIPDAFREEGA